MNMLKKYKKIIIVCSVIVGVVVGIGVGWYEDNVNPDVFKNITKTAKQEWMNNMVVMFPIALCAHEDVVECNEEEVRELLKTCLFKLEPTFPEYFNSKTGYVYGATVGLCVSMINEDSFTELK